MLIINADIRTMAEKNYPCGYIQIEKDKITGVGPMESCPKETGELLDARGGIAIPGLIDSHCHIGMWEDGMGFEGDDGNEDTDPSTPHLRGIDGVNPMDKSFKEALEWGVTTVVTGPGSANPIAGQMCALKTYGRRVDDMVLREPLAIKMAMGENPKTSYHARSQSPVTRMAIAAIIREQLMKAKKYQELLEEAAQDDEMEEPEYDAKCEALLPLLKREVPAHIHAHRADDIFTALRIAKEFQFDYVIVHGTEGHLIADLLAQEQARIIAGPIIGARTKPELSNASAQGVGILHKSGVSVAISTDHPEVPCYYLLLSAQIAMDEGLAPQAALRAITIDAAKICGIDGRVGSIEVGKDADILLFEEEPMTTRHPPKSVIINGNKVK